MDETSTNLNLPYLQAAQAQKHLTHNAALERLDAVVQLVLQSFAEDTPPLAPDEGQVWAIGASPVNDWVGHAGELAAWSNGGWFFVVPRPGWRSASGAEIRVWSGSAWVDPALPALQNLPGVGVNTSYDATNKLAVAAAATLFTHVGNGHQIKVNKNVAGDTASLLFQTGFSGRAEMGTTGSDDFALKTSADGSAWHVALTVAAASGRVGLPVGAELATGSAAAPSLSFAGDADTGLFRVTDDVLGLAAGGAERVRVTTAGMQVTGLVSGTAVTQSATDGTAGRLLKVGDSRISATDAATETTDLNAVVGLGFWSIGAAATNQPDFLGGTGTMVAFQRGSNRRAQIAANGGLGNRWAVRTQDDSGTWHAWARLFHSRNLLGTVTQSAGVPTGAVIETGSNANGTYMRLADGTQLCWHTIDDTAADWTTASGSLYRRTSSLTWTFPAAFVAAPTVAPSAHFGDDRVVGCRPRGLPTTTSVSLAPWGSVSAAAGLGKTVFAYAVGRWF